MMSYSLAIKMCFPYLIFISGACSYKTIPVAAVPIKEGYVTTDDNLQLFYKIVGNSGDTILVLHGGPALDMGYLAPDLEPLSSSHVLIFYDQRGGGSSTLIADSTKINMAAHIADVEAVRRHFNIQSLNILGHSWGALLAAGYALHHPDMVRKIVFASPAPLRRNPYWQHLNPTVMKWMDSTTLVQVQELRRTTRDTTIDAQQSCKQFWQVFKRGFFADPFDTATINRMKGDFCTASSASIRNGSKVNAYSWASIGEWDWRNDFKHFKKPVLIITGKMDINPTEAMLEWKEAFPNSTLVLIEAAGHYPQVEKPKQFFSNVQNFLLKLKS